MGIAEVGEGAISLALSLRNVGSGIAVLHGWRFDPEARIGARDMPAPEAFTSLSRDLYVPAGDVGFWQGTFRDPASAAFTADAGSDRKSTRLNSSHMSISYAVFCLKKKKKTAEEIVMNR